MRAMLLFGVTLFLGGLAFVSGCGGTGGSGTGGSDLSGVYAGTLTPAGGAPINLLIDLDGGNGFVIITEGGESVFATVKDASISGSIVTILIEEFSSGEVTKVVLTGTPRVDEISGSFEATMAGGTETGAFVIRYQGDNGPANFSGVWRGTLTESAPAVRGDAPVIHWIANLLQSGNSLSGTVTLEKAGPSGEDVSAVLSGRAIEGSAALRLVASSGSMNWSVQTENNGLSLGGRFVTYDLAGEPGSQGTVAATR